MIARRIDQATAAFRAGMRDLHTDDGQKLYSDEEHERRMEALLERFDREVEGVVRNAAEIRALLGRIVVSGAHRGIDAIAVLG